MWRDPNTSGIRGFLDLAMPELDGAVSFAELKRIRPDLRVILSGGYREQAALKRFTGKGVAGFIEKPYQNQVLQHVVELTLKK